MKRREMIIKSLKLGAVGAISGNFKSLNIFIDKEKKFLLRELTGNPLRFPPIFTNGGTMTLGISNVNVWPGQTTQVIAINGSYPGPTVLIEKGSTFTANFINQLNEPATIHWHGINLPELMDGHPKDSIAPGGTYTYTFPIIQRAGTTFYHSHAHMLTGKHVYKGFGGFFIIDDPDEIQFGLPRGNYDIPLAIQDKRAINVPEFTYELKEDDVMHGYLGDIVLVNGTPEAYFEVLRTLYRFRLLNSSNARVYKIALSDNSSFHIIATDGGLKDIPAQISSFYLSPGERADILLDFSPYSIGQNVTLKSLPYSSAGPGNYRQGIEMNILRFDITGNGSSGGIVPSIFTPISYYNPADVKTVRNFVLTMDHPGTMGMHKINGLVFEMERIDWQTPLDSLEEWRIINATNEFHPMHSHVVQFQVYSRNGNTNLPPVDKGWKDTVLVNPYETVRVLVKFTDYRGIYLFHCHNLEHEDDGMMLNFKIVDPIGINKGNTNIPDDYNLYQNYPNPFNPDTKIKFDIPRDGDVTLKIYDSLGKELSTLVDGYKKAGTYEVRFDSHNLSSGEYFYKLESGNVAISKKMTLIK